MINIVLLAGSYVIRAGLRVLLEADPAIAVLQEAGSWRALAMEPGVDILIVAGEAWDPEQCAAFLSDSETDPAVLVLEHSAAAARQLDALDLHAWGLLAPESSSDALLAAVYALEQGLVVGYPGMMQEGYDLLAESGGAVDALIEPLTARELEVLQLLSEGLSNKQIAERLIISAHTVKFHISSVYGKMGASNRAEAVRLGIRMGLVTM